MENTSSLLEILGGKDNILKVFIVPTYQEYAKGFTLIDPKVIQSQSSKTK